MTLHEQRERILAELRRVRAGTAGAVPALTRRATAESAEACKVEPIAIVGLAGQFPGCGSVAEFWRALAAGRTLIGRTPAERFARWRENGGAEAERVAAATAWGGFIPNVRGFDPAFFNLPAGAADFMDPRQRLLLMAVYQSFEDAGLTPRGLRGQPVGVFVAIEEDEYFQELAERGLSARAPMGNAASLVANQISYFFDLRGPSEVVNTMCSGGAVALHRAVASLRAGESGLAVVGGVNLLLRPEPYIGLMDTGQLSADGRVRSFGKGAAGFVRSEGVVSVVLKRLADAERDGDPVHAVIRHTAVNFNGQGGMSMAAPSVSAHAEVIAACYRQAGVDPRRVRYVEAQGMGNPVADLAEWRAIERALRTLAEERGVRLGAGQCRISTLKPVAGHMHAASALAALCKVVGSFRAGRVEPIAGFAELNPDLVEAEQPCRPVVEREAWAREDEPRVAGLHAYGAGGNNAHVLLEEYAAARGGGEGEAGKGNGTEMVLPFSGGAAAQLREGVSRVVEAVKADQGLSLRAVAKTLQSGRDAMAWRVAFVARSREEWVRVAEGYGRGEGSEGGGVFEGEAASAKAATEESRLAAAWVRGENVAWPKLAGPRVHLPGYGFALQECWYERAAEATEARTGGDRGIDEAEGLVRRLLAPFFKVAPEAVELERAFRDVGFDSVLVAQAAARLRQEHGVRVEPAQFFEFTTPRRLVEAVAARLAKGEPVRVDGVVEKRMRGPQEANEEGIAIVGVAGRYPEAETVAELWENLRAGRECIREVPGERWAVSEHFEADPDRAAKAGKSYGKWGGFIRGLNEFDALFFRISRREAETMSPKERLVLQSVWHALEDAGLRPGALAGKAVGVFIGATRAGWEPYPGTFSSIPNRVSYFFDFRGPSVPIDTMCSSSLVAVHEACRHLLAGECELAIAGGVNLYLDPSHFAVLAHGRFLSADGRCRAFGAGANGMVPGEGVGTVVLKTLARARADGDRIHGVICSSATNHGGSTNGFTVPNPEAQRDVIVQALERGKIDPRSVTYIEAHGTGTVLGDPIEVRGLSEAYRKFTDATGFCRIGSLKGNLGHLEAAAGIAGLTKVLLQFRHRAIVSSLHAAELNQHIDFGVTPFVVAQSAEEWAPRGADGRAMRRRAGVSSFGAGGSNAHVIVEEFEVEAEPAGRARGSGAGGPQVIVLSARNRERLREVAQRLREFLAKKRDVALEDVAYTLQVGREAMEERLALVANSVSEVEARLGAWLENPEATARTWMGRVKSGGGVRGLSEQDMAPVWAGLLERGEWEKLAALWVEGASPDWALLQRGSEARRIELPLYPFARDVLPVPAFGDAADAGRMDGALHPLLHRNTSTLGEQRFTSVFSGEEFFFADHLVQRAKMLPAAAYLEWVREAFVQASGAGQGEASVVLSDVVWARPLCAGAEPVEAHVALRRGEDGGVRFEVFTETRAGGAERVVHSAGRVGFVAAEAGAVPALTRRATIEAEGTGLGSFGAGEIYAVFAELGIDYGPGHRVVESVQVGADEVLARLRLPQAAERRGEFVLHPALVDGALQATMGFALRERAMRASLPYAVERVEVLKSCPEAAWAIVRRPRVSGRSEKLERFDVEICDDSGAVCVRLLGFAARVLEAGRVAGEENAEVMLRVPSWVAWAEGRRAAVAERVVLLLGVDEATRAEYERLLRSDRVTVRVVAGSGKAVAEEFKDAAVEVLHAVQEVAAGKPKGETLVQVLVPARGEAWAFAGLAGLLRTVQLEMPRVFGQGVEVSGSATAETRVAALREAARRPEESWVRHDGRTGLVPVWKAREARGDAARPWREGGVYLITGGLGGLGRIFAEEIATQAKGVRLVLVGRRAKDEEGEAFLAKLRGLGAEAEYGAVDLARGEEVEQLVGGIVERHGALHGVVHAAGVLRDQFLLRKTAAEMEAVFAPKVAGAIHLDAATAKVALECFVVFASGASLGSAGQGDYAAANAWLDAFAHERTRRVARGERRGRTLAIDWPFWREGGMRVDEAMRARLAETLGVQPLETRAGIEAFYRCWASEAPQVLVVHGVAARVREWLREEVLAPAAQMRTERGEGSDAVAGAAERDAAGLEARVAEYLRGLVAETLKIRPEEIEADKDLAAYGLDSILVLELNNQLERTFPRLSKTLFFEYATLGELVRYFVEAHGEIVAAKFGRVAAKAAVRPAEVSGAVAEAAEPRRWPGWQAVFQSFALFEKAEAGFSFARMAARPAEAAADVARYLEGQVALRRLLFRGVDLGRAKTVVDLGCGRGADLIELASAFPRLRAEGLTIDGEEAEFAREMAGRLGVAERVRVLEKDCTEHTYPGGLDVAFSVQVMHFIADLGRKRALFEKLGAALGREGVVVMAEFVCHLKRAMKDPVLRTTVHTAAEWAGSLATGGLRCVEVIDASAEIVNFLRDPELEREVAGLAPERQQEIRKYNRQIDGLEAGWVSYCVLRVVRDGTGATAEALRRENLEKLERRTAAREVWNEIGRGAVGGAYADVLARFGGCVEDVEGGEARLVHEDELAAHPELARLVREIDAASPPVGYERMLYAHRFVVPEERAYVRLIVDAENRLLIPLLPMSEGVYRKLAEQAQRTGQRILLVDTWHEWMRADGVRAVPLGVVQTLDLEAFTLAGTRMRKLRYLANKFSSEHVARVAEWTAGMPVAREELRRVMLAWAAAKRNVITSTVVCMEHLLAGELPAGHRVFLTYAGEQLCSAIVIAKCGGDAWLMDQEFYDPEAAPLGHMEFAVVEMMTRLKREGARYFSLGVTWYPLGHDSHPAVEAETWAWVREQGERATLLGRIFEQGKTNYQFKKKFGVEGELLFGYLPREAPLTTVLHYWSAFYQHSRTAAQVAERLGATEARWETPERRRAAWDAARSFEEIPYSGEALDLMSDTWFGREAPAVQRRMEELATVTVSEAEAGERVRAVFPFRHLIFTGQGREAEALFYGAFSKARRKIFGAIPWTSTLGSQLGNGFEVVELPSREAVAGESEELFRGGVDIERLREALAANDGAVALVSVEVLSNATGGHPVRLGHLRELRAVARERGVPLVLDASRIVRNAVLLREEERECRGKEVWALVRETAGAADHVVTSLTKDFGVSVGGLIATNDDALAERIRAGMTEDQRAKGGEALRVMGAALGRREEIVRMIEKQGALVRALHERLRGAGVPMVGQARGHALVIDAAGLVDEPESKAARLGLVRELFVQTGIRAGLHQAGRQRGSALARGVRLAFPLGLTREDEEAIFAGVTRVFGARPEETEVAAAGPERRERAEPIAIIGLSGKFPRSRDHYEFWERIARGESLIGPVPAERWTHARHHDATLPRAFVPGKTRCGFGAFVDGHDRFEAEFFNCSEAEVMAMDPQERLAMEAAWGCIEDAGYVPERLERGTGVFSGVTYNEYQKLIPRTTHSCFLTSRLAYFFNWHGPAMALDAGCASSMTALDAACRSLREGACPTALVVGANLILHPDHYASLSPELSASGRAESKPFGDADGWVPAEGVVAVLLKPLSAAQRDRDHVYAVIRSTRVGHEGKTSWFSAPSPKSQAAVIAANFAQAGIAPATISYVEAAANGSPLGDAIELEGLSSVFAKAGVRPGSCVVGTVKGNVGHGEGVSTLLQLAKVLLQFKAGTIYPLVHREGKNPNIRFEDTPFRLAEGVEAWARPEVRLEGKRLALPRRATISSFGGGGNMGHMILEEAPALGAARQGDGADEGARDGAECFLPVSAETPERLRAAVEELRGFFWRIQELDAEWRETYRLGNVMATLCEGRRSFAARVGFVVRGLEEFRAVLERYLGGEENGAIVRPEDGRRLSDGEVAAAMARGAWREVAGHWAAGGEIAWGDFFAKRDARRVPLPTRRFAGRRFEVSEAAFLRAWGAGAASEPNEAVEMVAPAAEESELEEVVRGAFARALRVAPETIDLGAPLERYGFDSAMVVAVTDALAKVFPRLSATVFFECETMRDVVEHLRGLERVAPSAEVEAVKEHGTTEQGEAEARRALDDLAQAILADRLSVDQILKRLNGTGRPANGTCVSIVPRRNT